MPRPSMSGMLAAIMQNSRWRGVIGARLPRHQPERMWVWMCKSLLEPVSPVPGTPAQILDGENHAMVRFDTIDDREREPMESVAVHLRQLRMNGPPLRRFRDCRQRSQICFDEFGAKSGTLSVVPVEGIFQIGLRLLPNADDHFATLFNNRAAICSAGREVPSPRSA